MRTRQNKSYNAVIYLDVFLTSFYMKNKEMTGSDSDKTFTDSIMELCLNLDNDTQSSFVQQCNTRIKKNRNKKEIVHENNVLFLIKVSIIYKILSKILTQNLLN